MRFLIITIPIVLLLLTNSGMLAQKMKYKDIYLMLGKKDFEGALPYLEKFLESNALHPSAVLQMGILSQDFLDNCQKAIVYFEKAMTLIDNKELKKNEKYYSEWNRRNLRTGKYGVNLDDLHLDIEKRLARCSQ